MRSIQYQRNLKTARTVEADYFKRYQHSIENPDEFWAEQAKIVDWIKPFTQVKNTSFDKDNFKIEWFADGELNVSANCLTGILKNTLTNLQLFGKVIILLVIKSFLIKNYTTKSAVSPTF